MANRNYTMPPLAERGISFLFIIAILALLLGILSGLRWPNIWAMTHYLFDYSSGFTKRGLIGEILSHVLGNTISYGTLVVLSLGIFVVWVLMLFLKLRQLADVNHHIWLAAAVVLISPGFVFLVHNMGYFDHVGLIVVFLSFFLPATFAGLLARIILCSVMVVMHEAFFLMFFPVVALEFALRAAIGDRKNRIAATFLLVSVTVATTYWVGNSTLPDAHRTSYTSHVSERAGDFAIREDAVDVLFRDGRDNIIVTGNVRQQVGNSWSTAIAAFFFIIPLSIALILASLYLIGRADLPDRTKLFLRWGTIGSAFSPLLLNVLAWDIWRFFALTQFSAFLALIAVGTHLRSQLAHVAWTRRASYVILILAFIGIATNVKLFESYSITRTPYLLNMTPVIDILQGNIRIPSW